MQEIGIPPVGNGDVSPRITKPGTTSGDTGFGELLKKSINAVNKTMQEAGASATGLVSGQHANIDETMIAMEKANVSFRLLTKVQNKVINAYQEIMRMQL